MSPPPLHSSLRLRLVQVVHRHGDRVPLHTFELDEAKRYWEDKIPTTSKSQSRASLKTKDANEAIWGQLTTLGRQQMYNVGQKVAKSYPNLVRQQVYSTNYRRTVESAESFFQGFYSIGNNHNNITNDINVDVVSGQNDMINSYNVYPEIVSLKQQVQDREFPTQEAVMEKIKLQLIKCLSPNLSFDNFNWMKVADYYWTRRAHGIPFIKGTEDFCDETIRHLVFRFSKFYSDDEILSRVSRKLLSHIYSTERAAAALGKENEPMLVTYSGHDVSILALLYALKAPCVVQVPSSYWPEYGSSITFECWEDVSTKEFYTRVLQDQCHEIQPLMIKRLLQ